MRLHLPKKFQAALMAAIASVSFTTLSSATLGAAVFTLAGHQAAAEDAAITATLAADAETLVEEQSKADSSIAVEEEEGEGDADDSEDADSDELLTCNVGSAAGSSGAPAGTPVGNVAGTVADSGIAAPAAAPSQQAATAVSGELPSDDLGFTTNPYATAGNSGPVFEMPAAAPAADFSQEYSSDEKSSATSTATGASTPALASASGFGASAGGFSSPFGLASATPLSVGAFASLDSAPLLGATGTNLVWEGDAQSKGTWQNDGDDATSPWRFTPEASEPQPKAFHNGDYALFGKSAEVTVVGTVQTSSIQLHKGTGNMLELTINTSEGAKLTADQVTTVGTGQQETDFNNKIITKGEGAIDFAISDPNFGTALSIENASAVISFHAQQKVTLYKDIIGSAASKVVLSFENDTTADAYTTIKGIDEYNVASGYTLQIESSMDDIHKGGFFLDKDNTSINLDSGSLLNVLNETEVQTTSLTITGTGTGENLSVAHFYEVYLNHGTDTAVYNLSNSVDVQITSLSIDENSGDTVMQVDDAALLYIEAMHAGDKNANETFLHAFKNGGLETERQKVTIDALSTYNGATIHLGAASTTQGASVDYQEAGTVKVGYITGNGTVVLENNAEVTDDGQSLTEVFDIEAEGTEQHAFTGTLRLAAQNDGTETQHKEAVALFRSFYTAYNAELELDAVADYTDYAFVMNQGAGMSCNGIQDVTAVKANSTAMIYSGTIGEGKDAYVQSDGQQRTLQLYAANGKNYVSSFGMSSGIDIDFSGAGSQTFKGDFSAFKGDVTVGGTKESGSTLSIIEQGTALKIENLLLRPKATLNVKDTERENQLIEVSGTLTAKNEISQELPTGSAVVNGDLKMVADSIYDVSDFQGSGGLNLTGSLTFVPGAQLSESDMEMINYWLPVDGGKNSMYDLAFNVTSLNGSTDVSGWTEDGQKIGNPIDASTIFTGQFWEGEYYICFSGTGNGGYGDNVGTVYLYHAMPEPTTGTLSLLALAALAARRRRK